MDIRVYDKNFLGLGVVDELESLIWTIRYFEPGEIKIQAPMTPNNKALLVAGNLLVKHDEYIDYTDDQNNVWRRMMVLTFISYKRDSQGQDLIEATGSEISSWLNQRLIYPQLQIDGTSQDIVNFLIDKNVGSGAAARRQIPDLEILDQADLGGSVTEYSNEELVYLGDEINNICVHGKIGFTLYFCEKTAKLGFYLYKGRDLTAGNTEGNDPCIFSRDFDNIREQSFEDDLTNISNYAYVQGAEDSEGVKELVTVDGDSTAAGLELKEVYIDASSISRNAENDEGQTEDIPVETYRALLATKGMADLAKYVEVYSFDSVVNLDSNIRYKRDFDIGDRVTCLERSWNITINSRITEITQTYEKGHEVLTAVFGESAPTLMDKIKKKAR